MKFTKQDLAPSRNMLKALGKGKWDLDGMEILAFSEMMRWFSALQKTIELEMIKEEEDAKKALAPIVPVPVENPIKPMELSPAPIVPRAKKRKD